MKLKIVIRNLQKRFFLNLIKVMGLMLAFSSLLLISLYMKHELSYDRFHANSERIYRFTVTSPSAFSGKHFARIWGAGYIPELARTFPEIESYVRLSPISGGLIEWEEKKIRSQQAFFCDSTFLDVFKPELISGNPKQVLNGPSRLLISESYAKRIFGEEDPVGQVLSVPAGRFHGQRLSFEVTGVMKDLPASSHFHPEFVTTTSDPGYLNGWAWTYLLLKPGTDPQGISDGFPAFLADFGETTVEDVDYSAHLQSIRDIHLQSHKTREIESNSNMGIIYSFSIAVLILLFIALVNYANLNLGMLRFSNNLVLVGRIFGASRRQQLKYFLLEGIVIVSISLLLSLFLIKGTAILIAERFNLDLMEGELPFVVLVLTGISFLGLLAGFLPQAQNYFKILLISARRTSGGKVRKGSLSKGLIFFQYTIATVLIISVLVIQRQATFAMRSGMGSENKGVICLEKVHSSICERFPEFKKELLNYASVSQVSGMMEPPGGEANDLFRFSMEGYVPDESKTNDNYIGILPCDYSLPALFNMHFAAGRDFSPEFIDTDGSGEYIINEAAVERLGYQNAADVLDKDFQLFFHNDFIQIPAGKIIGVVEDFHLSSLKRPLEPMVLFKRDTMWIDNLLISFEPGNLVNGIHDVEKTWKELFPGHTFDYEFVEEMYSKIYLTEKLQAMLLLIFTLIALFICSMGLLGLSLLASQRRIKEIGVRKVNGATVLQIVGLLNREFLLWIALSYLLSMPLAYLAMRRWLEVFAYKTTLSWWIFLLAGLITLLLSALPISLQSLKAGRMNPVDALRDE